MNTLFRTILSCMIAGVGLLTAGAAYADGNAEAGAGKSAVCAGCHGPDGISVNPLWPNLAGQHAEYLDKQIKAFRDGSRVEPTMQPFVATLNDADAADLAAFFASRKACQ
jgi:cytochrome c553